MRETVTQSEELRKLGEKLIQKHKEFEDIRDAEVRIGYCVSDDARIRDGKAVLGECTKVKPLYQAFIPYDFLITFFEPNIEELSKKQKEILMMHELLHIGISTVGELTYRIVPHDVEDFREIIERYGLDWAATDGE